MLESDNVNLDAEMIVTVKAPLSFLMWEFNVRAGFGRLTQQLPGLLQVH